jgi:hypothetical protein
MCQQMLMTLMDFVVLVSETIVFFTANVMRNLINGYKKWFDKLTINESNRKNTAHKIRKIV